MKFIFLKLELFYFLLLNIFLITYENSFEENCDCDIAQNKCKKEGSRECDETKCKKSLLDSNGIC